MTDYIFEQVYVETPVDTDEDGYLDLILVHIKRPVTTEKVPVVYIANPYLMHCNEDWYDLYDVKKDLKVYENQNISYEDIKYDFTCSKKVSPKFTRTSKATVNSNPKEFYDDIECISSLYDRLLPLNYATVYSGGLGSKYSEGLTISGSREEILAFKAVIDWLNGKARAFTDLTGEVEVIPNWTTGKVAMSGKSYLGTMCMGVATTGVEGLETIIPEAGIASWYDYYRQNGLVSPAYEWNGDDLDILSKYCFSRALDEKDFPGIKERFEKSQLRLQEMEDRESGNYNRFWDERNYLNLIDQMKCSALIIQGLADFNVKPTNATKFFEAIEEKGLERKMLMHRGKHIYVYNLDNSPVFKTVVDWLDHYLKGVDNGINNSSKVIIEDDYDVNMWHKYDTWSKASECIIGNLEAKEINFNDDPTKYTNDATWENELLFSKDNNAVRIYKDIEKDLVISGDINVEFEAAIDTDSAILSAMLVDIGEENRVIPEIDGDVEISFTFSKEETPSAYRIISWGNMNAQNRDNNYSKCSIEKGKFYKYSLDLIPMDFTVKKGHKLLLVLYGYDPRQTLIPSSGFNGTIKLDSVNLKSHLAK